MRQAFSYTTISMVILLSFFLTTLTGCETKKTTIEERNEVRKVMEMRQQAIQTKDIELYKQAILPAYSDAGIKLDGIIEAMQENFNRYEHIEFTFQRSTVDMDMNSARMVGQISYKGTGMEKPVYDQERTIFRRVNGEWKISAGIKVLVF